MGPFSSTLNATKHIRFSPDQGVKRMLIKIGVGVSDPLLKQASTNGTLLKVKTNTTQKRALRIIPFLNLEIRDLLVNNSIVVTQKSGY